MHVAFRFDLRKKCESQIADPIRASKYVSREAFNQKWWLGVSGRMTTGTRGRQGSLTELPNFTELTEL
jgi:hypothetical protein